MVVVWKEQAAIHQRCGADTISPHVDMRTLMLLLNINIDFKEEDKEDKEDKEETLVAAWAIPWDRLEMSLDPRSMANATANEILMQGQFPEQGSELVSTLLPHFPAIFIPLHITFPSAFNFNIN